MSDNNLEKQIGKALEQPCACRQLHEVWPDGYSSHPCSFLAQCPICLPKRIAAALWQMAQEAYDAGDAGSSEDIDFTGALRALKGEP